MSILLAASEIISFDHTFSYFHPHQYHNNVPLNLFVRPTFTKSNNTEREIIQGVLNLLVKINNQPYPLNFLTGLVAERQENFRQSFEQKTGLEFNQINYCTQRLKLLNQADAMIIIRTSFSESSILEIAYNIFAGCQMPMFFAVWRNAVIKNTLIYDLDKLSASSYVTFDHPEELKAPLVKFLAQIAAYGSLTR
ncbi:MAG TPA: hypothetical protein VK203_18285 [Nostocaceae cyanobacterium]|nr:hypothetical protein [Nostocaceae cyanobacterium]